MYRGKCTCKIKREGGQVTKILISTFKFNTFIYPHVSIKHQYIHMQTSHIHLSTCRIKYQCIHMETSDMRIYTCRHETSIHLYVDRYRTSVYPDVQQISIYSHIGTKHPYIHMQTSIYPRVDIKHLYICMQTSNIHIST